MGIRAGTLATTVSAVAVAVLGFTGTAHASSTVPSVPSGYVSDALGVHRAGLAQPPTGMTPDAGCPHTPWFSLTGGVGLGPGWTALAIRTGACQQANLVGYHRSGFYRRGATYGQFICRGATEYGYGTNLWYQDSKTGDWSWAGGTSNPDWDGDC